MDEQQLKNQSEAFEKSSHDKGLKTLEKINDKKKKAQKIKRIIKILLNPMTWKIFAVAMVMGGIILLPGIVDVIGDATQKETNEAKKGAVSVSMSSPSSGENTNNTAIVIKPTQNNDSYEITTTYDDENIDDIRKELDEKYSNDLSGFNDFETKVIAGLEENGLDLDSYTTEELKCLPQFLKAESCTKFLDLRSNSEKFDSSGNYNPEQVELEGNKVPGIILVQRTNTRETTPVTLEYKKLEDFNTLVSNNDINVKNYFTINEKGNLVIAKWDNVTVTVNGNFPQEVPTEERVQNRNENIISTTEIPYSQYVEKFTMPFDFLTQLLVITEDPEFCLAVADIVLGSKIVINIQEEETITTDVESRTYDVHSKEEKYIDYEVAPGIEAKKEGYFLNLTKDDEGNACTTYKNEKTDVTITTVYTSHTYSFEITEADTWIAHYKKTYAKQTEQTLPETISNIDSKGEYKPAEEIEEIVIENDAQILNDNEAKTFKEEKEKLYKDNIPTPRVSVQNKTEDGKTYKKIYITPSGKFTTNLVATEYESQEIQNEDGTVTIKYNMPQTFTATSIKKGDVPAQIGFTFKLNSTTYTYSLMSNTMDNIKCNISKLRILPNYKINLISTIKTNVTKHPSDPNPVTNTHIYAKDDSGNFEKFLLAYDNNKKAVELIRDVDSWLFEMMEENQNTIDLMDTIKYLLYVYDGTDYGVTELDLEGFFATDMNNVSSGTSSQQFLKFLRSWEGGETVPTYKNENGEDCYKVESDGSKNGLAVGYGVDIATHGEELRLLGYGTAEGDLIPVEVVDEIEKRARESVVERVKAETSGLNLTEYQIYALASRAYNCGVNGALKVKRGENNLNFVDSYKKYWNAETDDKFGETTDFSHNLYVQYMSKPVTSDGEYLQGLENRRKSEWSLFQTGYYGYDLKYGSGHGIDEYYTAVGAATDFTNNINLYNDDGTVNKDAIEQLENWITKDLLNTKVHYNYEMQGGPFAKWWNSNNNWFTSAGLKFQCTWYVYGRANQYLEMFGTKYTSWPGTKNNAGKWYNSSTDGGEKYFECGSEPRANSIAVWKDGSKAGHVAYVEAVDTVNNIVYISHAGGGQKWFGVEGKSIEQMRTLGGQLVGYVYLDSPK